MKKGILNQFWGGTMKKKLAIITAMSMLTFAAVASFAPKFNQGPNLEVNELNTQINTLLNKTSNLKQFEMAKVEL